MPLITAVYAFPHLIAGLGDARFGALSLAWVLTGYANIFDFGLGRALTQLVARDIGLGNRSKVNLTAWTAFVIAAGAGLLAMLAMYAFAPLLVDRVLGLEGALRTETLRALRLISFFLPVVILTTGIRGLLEAYQLFGTTNLIRVPVGILNYLAPLAVLPFSTRLEPVVLAVILTRCLETLAYFVMALRRIPDFSRRFAFSRVRLRELLGFGGWMTVSNIIAPIMLNFDRFFIASLTSLAAVTYYVTPYTVVTKLRIVPTGLMAVLFPAFSETLARDTREARRLYLVALRTLALILVPVVILMLLLARPGLVLWLGPEFAERSFRVAQILAVGVLVHSLGQTPFTFLQASGRADITAKVHLLEVPFYLVYMYALVRGYGIQGAAVAWLLRVTLSAVTLTILAETLFRRRLRAAKVATPA